MKYIFPIFYFVFGILVSAFLFVYLERLHMETVKRDLLKDTQFSSLSIENKFTEYAHLLDAGVAYYHATDRISAAQFTKFSLPLLATHKNAQAFSLVPRIKDEDREKYLAYIRKELGSSFDIRERNENNDLIIRGNSSQYFPVTFIEPLKGNEAAVGFDIGSNQSRLAALNAARDSGLKVATAPLTLVQETGSQKGILIVEPIYLRDHPHATLSERHENLAGYASLVLRVGDIIKGTRVEELLGDNIYIQDVTDPDHPELLYGFPSPEYFLSYDTHIETAGRTWKITTYRADKKTTAYWFPYFILAFGMLFFGLTAFIFLQLIQRREIVRREVKQRTEQLNKLVDKLADSNEELSRFAYVCSHDLQEPLRMIRSFSERLETHMGEDIKGDEKAQKYFKFITDGASHAQALISDILAYSAVDTDTKIYEKVETQDLIDTIKNNLISSLEDTGGQISSDNLPEISGNKTQLFQLFQNLITNGLKYQKKGHKPHVHITSQDLGEHWQFSIKDNGIGMESRHLSKIFDVFQRLHKRSRYSGTGVGLSICKKVAERHGGDIWAESDVGQGSTFHFTILKRPNLGDKS